MTVATWDHHDLDARDYITTYSAPEFSGYPEEGDEVEVVYRSKRTGDLTRRRGTVTNCYDPGHSLGTAHPKNLELTVDTGDAELKVWGGGSYGENDRDTEGRAPAQVWTESFVRREGGRTRQNTIRGRLVRLVAPNHRLTVDIENVPEDRVERVEDALADFINKRVSDRTAQRLLETDITREQIPIDD